MSSTFTLPDLGEGLTEADLVRWLVAEGDEIAVDQPVCEVETAKAIVEVPSPYAGTVLTLHGAEGQTMEVGKPLFTVGAADDAGARPSASRRPAMRSESCSFIWHPKVRKKYVRATGVRLGG